MRAGFPGKISVQAMTVVLKRKKSENHGGAAALWVIL
jgi:hypothetical protein